MVSMLQVRGIVNWGMGDTRNVTGGTERLVRDLNNITEHGANQANRAIARSTEGNLQTLNNLNEKAGQRLIKQKQHIADAGAKAISSVKPKPLPAGTGVRSETKKRQLEIDNVVAGAERAHARFKKLQKDTGIGSQVGGKTMAQDLGRFYAQDREDREGQIDLLRTAKKETKERIKTLDDEYEAMHKGSKAAHENRQELAEEIQALEYLDTSLKQVTSDHQKLTNVERIEANERKKNGEMAKRLHANQREMEKLNYQMAREKLQMQRQIGEEIDRTSEQVGTSLRNAFTYATVAITAFYYKLSQTTQVFMEFESELVNAQSIWQSSNEQLFAISDSVVQFGQKFGIEMGKATEGLYQYASAGVEASEAMEMLEHTLTLSMAVQGDHNTLAKLTTQTIMGFGMEFSDAAEVTDKFAHAINKSLIEWDDLASSIKFALPFFISTGQSLDQLLGALAVLTNRALEAGIAGRGLRQALAEFTQHAEDNAAAFHEMGVEILDAEGNMHELTNIAAQFQAKMGEGVNDMDVMMALMEDLNIRGATAFVHLVQNADEFQAQVNDLQNSAGASAEMAGIQQVSLANQIQLVRNALLAPFLMSDKVGEAQGYLNEFQMELHRAVQVFEGLIVTGEEGEKVLTDFGQFIKDFVVIAIQEFVTLMIQARDLFLHFAESTDGAYTMLNLFITPLRLVLNILGSLTPEMMNTILLWRIMSKVIPLNTMRMITNIKMRRMDIQMMQQEQIARMATIEAQMFEIETKMEWMALSEEEQMWRGLNIIMGDAEVATHESVAGSIQGESMATWELVAAQMAVQAAMFAMIYLTQKFGKDSAETTAVIGGLAGAVMGYAIAKQLAFDAGSGKMWATVGIGMIAMAAFNLAMRDMMKMPEVKEPKYKKLNLGGARPGENQELYDLGGTMMSRTRRLYDNGGIAGRHFPALIEPGETITSKTQNMLGGDTGGLTINISGDVYDGDNFAEKVGEVLPSALRRVDESGGFA